MKIICSTNIPYAFEAFGPLGDVEILGPREITADRVRDAELLITRSTLKVNSALLEGSRVKFVGTATIGTDHMDTKYLDKAGIAWAAAPGCNANSVSEYVAAALLCLGQRRGFQLEGKTIGVIGVGNVGKQVVKKARSLGMRVLQNDPPRRAAENDSAFLPLEEVLGASDIITLHVPLTAAGPYPTKHLADRRFFERLKPGAVFLNTARGAVMDSEAFLSARDSGKVSAAVIDTWENEPVFRPDVMAKADIATPHIAGHSFDGKVNGTLMIYRAACRFLGVGPDWTPENLLPKPVVPEIRLESPGPGEEAGLWRIVRQVYDIEADDRRMRPIADMHARERGARFEKLRQDYPVRREFRFTSVFLPEECSSLRLKLRNLGFADQ